MDLNFRRAWNTHWNKRRIMSMEEMENELFQALGPPWMETGIIRYCPECKYRVWEFLELPDGCPSCHYPNTISQHPSKLDKLIHWWRVDNRSNTKQAAKRWQEVELVPLELPQEEESGKEN